MTRPCNMGAGFYVPVGCAMRHLAVVRSGLPIAKGDGKNYLLGAGVGAERCFTLNVQTGRDPI
ncbi:hypothetical protein COO20_12380 [Thalassospira marina]|uniref:Uncharacterized protein n=1 Tax=Thalassospira marina TaxID=2048283 RepID=A0A2N3KTC5_9PROT|nr:hypothetical protein COO20_12380 [Thalassospira marina]